MKELNNSINEDYCSFEVSKLLKEKGAKFINEGEDIFGMTYAYKTSQKLNQYKLVSIYTLNFSHDCQQYDYVTMPIYDAPTIQMAIEWIRINLGIWIYVIPHSTLFRPYAEEIIDKDRFGKWEGHKYSSPQEAYESAILFTLNNL